MLATVYSSVEAVRSSPWIDMPNLDQPALYNDGSNSEGLFSPPVNCNILYPMKGKFKKRLTVPTVDPAILALNNLFRLLLFPLLRTQLQPAISTLLIAQTMAN